MTPLIDIIFQLVLFFMLTSTFVKQEAIDVFINDLSNPTMLPSDAMEINSAPPIIIGLKGEEILYNSTAIDKTKLSEFLKVELENNSKQPIKIITQKGVSVQSLISAIDIARTSGATNISIDDGKDYGGIVTTQGIVPSNLPELPDLQSTKDSDSKTNAGSFDFDKLQHEFTPQF